MLVGGSLHPIESSDDGEIGTIPDGYPILDDVDNCGDLVRFVQSMMDALDEAIDDIRDYRGDSRRKCYRSTSFRFPPAVGSAEQTITSSENIWTRA
jgi:hypothetical protein